MELTPTGSDRPPWQPAVAVAVFLAVGATLVATADGDWTFLLNTMTGALPLWAVYSE